MASDPLSIGQGHGCAVKRFADAMLRSLGGAQVTLRVPDASRGDTGDQLGLTAPQGRDLPVSPALIKSLEPAPDGKRRFEVVISTTSLLRVAKDFGISDVPAWLLTLQGVLLNDHLLRISEITVDRFCGTDCLYHLTATE